jgi:glycosyltransferase domain-containing protein
MARVDQGVQNTMNDVCIVIPTHERPAYLRRCIAYYASFACQVVICDSSVTPYGESLPQNMRYHHWPGKRFAEKVSVALTLVDTDLVALAPDDDFLFEAALLRGAAALRDNPTLRACVGDVLAYPDRPPFQVIGRCAGRAATAASSDATLNIHAYLAHYHQVLWSLFRRDTLLLCYENIGQAAFSNENFFELSIAALCAGRGGIYYLDDYWILREVSQDAHWGSRHAPITSANVSTMDNDVLKFRQLCDRLLFAGAGDVALSAYLSRHDDVQGPPSALGALRRILARVVEIVRTGSLGRVKWETDPRFVPIRKAIGY